MSAEKSLKVIADRLEHIDTLMVTMDERSSRIEEHLKDIAEAVKIMAKKPPMGSMIFGDIKA